MKKIRVLLLLVTAVGLSSCLVAGKVTINFVNSSSSPVNFGMNGSPITGNPVAAGQTSTWTYLSPGTFTLTAAVADTSGQTSVSTTVDLAGSQIFWWTIRNGLTQSGTIGSY